MCDFFLAKQDQLEARLNRWLEISEGRLRVDWLTSHSGHKVYALSVSDFAGDPSRKRAHYFAQPHAHEPGATAGMMDVIEQLLIGKDLLGKPTELDLQEVLSRTVLTFNPIGNPQGRQAAPVLFWDGSRYSNHEFWCWMRGTDPDDPGHCWKRLDLWDSRTERAPDPVGIVYEQIDEFRYVEPNRSQLSSYFKLFHRMDREFHYEAWLDIHQTEFVDSDINCEVIHNLGGRTDDRTKADNEAWGRRIIRTWQDAGFRPHPQPVPLGYAGQQAAYFRENWGKLDRRMNILLVEVKNNAPDATPDFQMKAPSTAIVTSIKRLLG